ncbi:MBL fold metallo-hydrolase [Halomontanus rarus]|uniref:MBL fold metallo-hydrolase n=1 Tax=Halomontanus rarus TaxID=3034020 RepID=UPI00293B90B9|nr:MBL fold metallo-hydrolase [Halovivax sp. KZCA124]
MTAKTWGLDLRIWDVQRGSAMWVSAAQKDVVIDMGASNFSPIQHLEERSSINSIDYMIITHPHRDHIIDITQYEESDFDVSILCRNKATRPVLEERIEEEDDESYLEIATTYAEFEDRYTTPATEDPSSKDWAQGATFSNYFLSGDDVSGSTFDQLNNLSVITVIERHGFKLVTAGDILEDGIETAMDDGKIMDAVEDAHVLVAPHHGRKSSYVGEFVDQIDPEIVLISDKADNGNNASGYYTKPDGISVLDEPDDEFCDRTVLTTRKDGRLRVRANHEDDWLVSFYDQFASKRAKGSMARKNYHRAY